MTGKYAGKKSMKFYNKYDSGKRAGHTLDTLIVHLSSSTAQLMLPLLPLLGTRYNVQQKEMTKMEERKNKHTQKISAQNLCQGKAREKSNGGKQSSGVEN